MKTLPALLLCLMACSTTVTPSASTPEVADAPSTALQSAIDAEQRRLTTEHDARRVDIIALDIETRRVLGHAHSGAEGAVGIGSTLKPFTIAAALDAGLDRHQRFGGEEGHWESAEGLIEDHEGSDFLDAERVIVRSSNVGAAKIAEAVGVPRIKSFLDNLGLAVDDERWRSEGLLLSTGIGVRDTPMNVAAAYATLAGGVDAEGQRVVSESTSASVRTMLERAVEEGTGRRAAAAGLRVAGKTGTVRLDDGHGAWFAGMVPAEDPQIVVVVYAEVDEGWGGAIAAPSFARIAESWNESGR